MMVSHNLFLTTLFLNIVAPWGHEALVAAKFMRDETPTLPYDPNTTQYCTWWYDNVDGSIPCNEMAAAWSISITDFRRWNPSITATCENFETGKSYCVEAAGEPPVVSSSSITSPSTVRSSVPVSSSSLSPSTTLVAPSTSRTTTTPVLSSTSRASTTPVLSSTSRTTTTPVLSSTTRAITTTTVSRTSSGGAPGPTQPGQVTNCNRWDLVKTGNTCEVFTAKYPGLTLADLLKWNPQIGSNCESLWVDTYLCTGVPGWVPSTTSKPPTTPTNGIVTPTPYQTGMVTNCDAFHKVVSGDQCDALATKYRITLAQFYAWNPAVGTSCGGLWLDNYVCVSIIGHTPPAPSTTNGISTPSPIQTGMVSNCDAFHKVVSGDQCGNLATKYGITVTQFYAWNPAVGSSCGSLWLDTYVCVSIVGVGPSPTTTLRTTTTKSGGVVTPTPFQPGMVTNCKTFRKVVSGDQCGTIATNAKIALADFYKWNPGVGSSCQSLWLGYYVCIGI